MPDLNETDAYEKGLRRSTSRKRTAIAVLCVLGFIAYAGVKISLRLGLWSRRAPEPKVQMIHFRSRALMEKVLPEGPDCLSEIDRVNSIAQTDGKDKVPAEAWESVQKACDQAAKAADERDVEKDAFRIIALRVRTCRPSPWKGDPKADAILLEERDILSRLEPQGLECIWRIDQVNLAAKTGAGRVPESTWDNAEAACERAAFHMLPTDDAQSDGRIFQDVARRVRSRRQEFARAGAGAATDAAQGSQSAAGAH